MWEIIWKTSILYVILIAVVRVMGKRQIGQLEPAEFVVTMLLANLATIPLEDPELSIFHGLLPIALVFCAELLVAWLTTCSSSWRKLLCGKPEILINDGKIVYKALKKNRVNLDELTMQLREKGIFDLTEVKFAILETNGQVSTLLYAKNQPPNAKDMGCRVKDTELPITLISDGKVMQENLLIAKKTESWLLTELQKRSCKLSQVMLFTVDAAGKVYFVRRKDG
ncbi:MAG: DUF421 domain-containing protein [Ruminococcaceae bacterium]|nr:DUF421 domain-containing protein [Oscillospiraceae bacterium]